MASGVTCPDWNCTCSACPLTFVASAWHLVTHGSGRRTAAFLVSRDTLASLTPGIRLQAASTAPVQLLQVMPATLICTAAGCEEALIHLHCCDAHH